MAKVNFGELGSVNFPDDWSEDELRSHLEQHGPSIRKELLARAQAINAQEAQDEAGPDTAMETLGSMAGSVVQGASATLGGAARTANRALNAAAGWYEPDLVETPVGRQALATEETPEETAARVNSGPGIELGNAIEEGAAKVAPTLPDSAAGFWTGDVPQGVGSAVAMVGPGLLAGPAAGLTVGFGAEADDAFSEEIRRQQEKGETPDMDKAMAKSLGYASVATAIESGLGAGRIIRKLKTAFGGNTVEETVNAAVRQGVSGTFIGRLLKGGAKDAAAGFTEEALQRMSEDLIVHGSVNVDGMMSEGAAGGVVQAILGLPANAKARRKVTSQTARDAASAGLSQTGSIVADMSNADVVATPDLTEADVADITAGSESVGTQSETDMVMQAAEDARRAAQAAQTLPTEPVATEGTGEDPAAVGAVEPIAEPSTPAQESNEPAPEESEEQVDPEPGVRQAAPGVSDTVLPSGPVPPSTGGTGTQPPVDGDGQPGVGSVPSGEVGPVTPPVTPATKPGVPSGAAGVVPVVDGQAGAGNSVGGNVGSGSDGSKAPGVPAGVAPAEVKAGQKNLGKNRRGFDVFEDANGVRSYVDGGVRVTEDVQIIPTRDGNRMSVDVTKRQSDHLTDQEWRDKQGQSPSSSPKPVTTNGTPPASDYGANNKLVSKDRAEELRKKLRAKLGQVSSGIDPELLAIGSELAVFHVEAGARKFADFAKAMIEDVGEKARPYLRSWYSAARSWPGVDEDSMDDDAAVKAAIAAEQKTPKPNETETGVRDGRKAAVGSTSGKGNSPGLSDVEGSGGNLETGVPPADNPPGGERNPSGVRQRPGQSGAGVGVDGTGGVQPSTPGDGTGNDSVGPGDGTGVDQPAHTPERSNYHLTDPEIIVGGGPKARFAKNRRALEILETLQTEGRDPTPAEKDALAAYTGWGSFGQELFNGSWEHGNPKFEWKEENEWLRNQLGEEGWKAAQSSIINAHYTDPATTSALWSIIRRLGFTGGRILEPSVGIGNFFSLMPRDIMDRSQLTGIELDPTTAAIAKILHPNANIQVKGYQDSQTADNFYDLVLGNWPFAKDGPSDRRFNHLTPSLHDYFFLKALAQVRPGGFVVGITSAGTMDKKNKALRRYMASQAELVASFRLPTGAFGKYAGTAVVTDVIILKKREKPLENSDNEGWIESSDKGQGFATNEYYDKRPENILGKMQLGSGTTYGRAGMTVIWPPGQDYFAALAGLPDKVPTAIYQPWERPTSKVATIANNLGGRQNSVVVKDGEVYQVQGEQLAKADDIRGWKTKNAKQNKERLTELKSAIGVRDALDTLMDAYRKGEPTDAARVKLRALYDSFVAAHGPMRKSDMVRYMEAIGDIGAVSLKNLEEVKGGTITPRAILDRDILRKKSLDSKGSIEDSYALARNNAMDFDLEEVARLSGIPTSVVRDRLVELDQIYQLPTGRWIPRDEYLSGNVRQKLREAQDAKESGNTGMDRNIESLEKAIPPTIPYTGIEVRMGAGWIAPSDYLDFMSHLSGAPRSAFEITKTQSGWKVRISDPAVAASPELNQRWGHPGVRAYQTLEAAMNGTSVKVTMTDQDGKTHVLEKETQEANGKIEAIREEFQKWIWDNTERTARLSQEYNEIHNATITPKRDGSHLRFEGLALTLGGNKPFSFRKHQMDAVWRFLMDRKGGGFHEVGTGKTFTIAGLVMEGRRLGVFRKPVVFAHNANSEGVYEDLQRAYPGGKFLYIDNLSPANRQSALRQIALDEWDAIVIPHSVLPKFTLRKESMLEIVKPQIDALEEEAKSAADEIGSSLSGVNLADEKAVSKALGRKPGTHTAKELVKARNRIITRIEKKAAEVSAEDAMFFEDLGIDAVVVDEAHIFKKINLATKKAPKGLNKNESDVGFSLQMLTDYLKSKTGGDGVFMFTGTPVTNTLNEVYNMMRYVMSREMSDAQIQGFDDWFNLFADLESDTEITSGGTYEVVERLKSFINVPELARLASRFFDVVRAKDMPEFQPRSSDEGMTEDPIGRPRKQVIPVVSEMSAQQREHNQNIQERFFAYRKLSGKEKRLRSLSGGDTPLTMSTEGSKAALDYRLLDLSAEDNPESKANKSIGKIIAHYNEHPQSTQMVFMEQGFNDYTDSKKKVKDSDGNVVTDVNGNPLEEKVRTRKFNLLRDMVEKLDAQGIPPEQIAVFAGMTLDPASMRPNDILRRVAKISSKTSKEDLAAGMREGKYRVAFGGTESMGTGVNAQTYLRAMHHLDAPWMPGAFEQRNGRGWRQGNKWNTVNEYRYFTEGPQDGKRWQTLLNKVRFIERFTEMIQNGGQGVRVLEGEGGTDLGEGGNDTVTDFEGAFSTAAGDPRLMLKATLEKAVDKLQKKKENHISAIQNAQREIRNLQGRSDFNAKYERNLRSEFKKYQDVRAKPFSIEVDGKTYTDRAAADEALKQISLKPGLKAQFGPFKVVIPETSRDGTPVLEMTNGDTSFVLPSVASIDGTLRNLGARADRLAADSQAAEKSIERLKEVLTGPFSRENELANKEEALRNLISEINRSPTPAPAWLRNGAPAGSLVYRKRMKEREIPGGMSMAGSPSSVFGETDQAGGTTTFRPYSDGVDAYDVAAHRWDNEGYWILYDAGSGELKPMRYNQALDETGKQLLPDVPFEPPPTKDKDKVLAALDKAIDATSTQGKLFDAVAGVSMSVANTILRAVRAGYVGGKALTAAIRDAIADYRKNHPKATFDEPALSDWLSSQVTGAAEVDITPEGKRSVNMGGTRAESKAIEWLKSPEFLYVRETEAGRMEAARKIIDSFAGDLRAALRFVTVPDQMSGVTASISEVTAAEIANQAHEKSVAAANTPDMRQWEALRDQAIEVAKGFLSGQGQGLQAGNQVAKVLGAGAAVAEYQDRIRMLRDKALAKKFPEVTSMRIKEWLDEAARQAIANIKTTMRKADNVVARVLKQARADYGETWSEIMQASAAAQGNHRREIFRRILNHPSLKGIDRAGALELTNLLVTAWEKERMAIFRREFRKQVQLPNVREEDMAALQAATPAFVRQINLGLWDNEAFRNAVAPQFGVRAVTQEASSRIYAAAQVAQAAPEGPQRQTKYRQLAQMVSREAGVPPMEVIRGWWYASVLSGSGTQARNFIGNAAQLVDNFVAFSARSPQDIPRLISGLLRGMAQNATGEFGAILKRGQESTGRASEDIRNAGSAAETLAGDARLWARLFSNSKYVGRFMSAVDSFFYAANAEMMAEFMAVRAGRTEGVSTRQELNDYVSSALKLGPGEMAAAMAQAQAEAAAGLLVDRHQGTVNRRAYQILSEQRPADIRQEMHRYALEATLNNIPEGILGAIATSIINLRERYPVLTPVVPFVRISANVTNMLLDHSPAALVKLIAARPDGYRILGYDGLRYPNRRLTEEQFQQLRAKVVIGGTATIALAIAAGMHLDDDEPPFQITGSLDSLDFEKRRQLAEQGIKPYQIRFGNVGVDYRQTPLAMMLTMIGSVMDGIRYSKFDEKEDQVKYSALMASGATVIVDQSFLSGLQSILDRGTYGGKTDIGARFARGAASTIGGMMPRMFKDFDQMVNPDLKQAKGFWDNLLKEMPVARWSLQSRKNVLGEDVQRQAWPWSATVSTANPDPVWQELNRKAQAGVFLPVPSASARILKNGERVKMTDEEFDEYTTLTGEGYRKALEKDLSKIQKMTPEQFEVWIKATLEPIRSEARSRVR